MTSQNKCSFLPPLALSLKFPYKSNVSNAVNQDR